MSGPFIMYSPPKTINGECFGFAWIGQSFAFCDECGEPYWLHRYDARMRDGRWFRKLITRDSAERTRRRWEGW